MLERPIPDRVIVELAGFALGTDWLHVPAYAIKHEGRVWAACGRQFQTSAITSGQSVAGIPRDARLCAGCFGSVECDRCAELGYDGETYRRFCEGGLG